MIPERGLAKMKKKIITMLGIIIALFVMACGKQGNLDTGIYIEENETENYQNGNEKKLTAVSNENIEQVSGEVEDTAEEIEQNGNVTGKSIFDNSLAGEWRCVSVIQNGDENPFNTTNICFLPNGEFWGIGFQKYTDYMDANISPLKAYTNNDELYIWDALMTAVLETGAATQEEVDQYQDMKVTYFLEDISEPSNEAYMNYASYYKKFPNDKLTIHVTGKYQDSPVTFKKIDTTYIFERKYPVFVDNECLEPNLKGEWEDDMGNHWSFYYEKEDEINYEFKFKMTDTNGNEHIGDYYIDLYDTDDATECKEVISFKFEDFSTDYYKFIAYDGERLEFDDNGASFALTRE